MKEQKLPLEPSFNIFQKMILLIISIITLNILTGLIGMELNWKGNLFFVIILFFFFYLISLTFSKKGFIKKDKKLYRAKFFNGITLYKKKVSLKDRPVTSILKFKKRQKYPFFSVAKPDLDKSFNSFEIFVLNERHIKRDSVMYLKNEENAQKAIDFLTTDFPLKYEIFSPNFARTAT